MHYFCKEAFGCLGSDFRRFRAGADMTPALRGEVTAYQLCILDESLVESPHAIVSRFVSSSRASKPWTWFSSLRLDQNIFMRRTVLGGPASGVFDRLFTNWKCVGQKSLNSFLRERPVKMSPKRFIAFVYHIGDENRKALPVFKDRSDQGSDDCSVAVDDPERMALQKDFLYCVLPPRTYFSLPAVIDINKLNGLVEKPKQEASAPEVNPPQIFQLVNVDFLRKKQVSTERMRNIRCFACPAVLQQFCSWRMREYPGLEHNVYSVGGTAITDLLKLAPWDVLAKDLMLWTVVRDSDVQGCTSISQPVRVADRQWHSGK